ncbi:MAG TPA: dicarboxylate/amino acid:cation symporter [Blastocatellia bacterium]|nr:dicarboxylate/amino acid:cation symporter [Blastocatellia bacterium]HMV83071.1 dicarboxylate/amino acid:cation symporter [Blastocatellia bacterium]HMX25409.1 dicarboxylate/amino acid:cation symporter [Blastocatellia bacterium]HMY73055.1 dicarboxylate/amino acid:cation symporter [Blastocatellia bacterium]HNG30968.1 dicarboxylate/amino acid:cation symporter [Blastocatellia bacterium]
MKLDDISHHPTTPKKLYQHLYFQVLVAIAIGASLGFFFPSLATKMKPFGDGFIKLIKMLIAPIIFLTVVVGIATIGDLKKLGRVGLKSLLYFEVVTTLALVIGLVVVKLFHPGTGINANASTLDMKGVEQYATTAKAQTTVDFFLHIIPDTIIGAFAQGEILQVLLVAVLFGVALTALGGRGQMVLDLLEKVNQVFFGIIAIVMKIAPLGAFGAMAFTIGKYGIGTLLPLMKVMLCVYITCLLFIFVVLGLIARANGFSLWKFLRYIREEILIVLGTSSSESALPRMMQKLEHLGCTKSVVGLVIPTGYSFNLDGTSIYLTIAALFVAQATNTPLTLAQELGILGVLLLTSKGAAAVTGGGFITLAATLSSTGTIPVAGLTLLLGIDRFMSEARALTNLIGNGVATVVIARWEGEFDAQRAERILAEKDLPVFDEAPALKQ